MKASRIAALTLCASSLWMPPSAWSQPFKLVEPSLPVNSRFSYAGTWGDFNGDGFFDLFVANGAAEIDVLFENEAGHLAKNTDLISLEPANSKAGTWVDHDGDGDLDLLVAVLSAPIRQFENDGGQGFSELRGTALTRQFSNARKIAAADFDGDGDVDLLVSQRHGGDNLLFVNQGDGVFVEEAATRLGRHAGDSTCVEWADVDDDGDLDVMICNTGEANFLYQNLGSGNNWLHVRLHGFGANTSAIGARVTLWTHSNGLSHQQVREVAGGRGSSSGGYELAFGLGGETAIDSLHIRWPDGKRQAMFDIPINQLVTFTEPAVRLEAVRSDDLLLPGDNATIRIQIAGKVSGSWIMHRSGAEGPFVSLEASPDGVGRLAASVEVGDLDHEFYAVVHTQYGALEYASADYPLRIRVLQVEPVIDSIADVPYDNGGKVQLTWRASRLESQNGDVTHYSIWRSEANTTGEATRSLRTLVSADPEMRRVVHGGAVWEWISDQPSLLLREYSSEAPTLYDRSPTTDGVQSFMVVAHTADLGESYASRPASGYSVDNSGTANPTAIEFDTERAKREGDLFLFPNPFAGSATLQFNLQAGATVQVAVYDVLGRMVAQTAPAVKPAGPISIPISLRSPPGTYFFRVLENGHHRSTRPAILLQ